MINEKIKQEFLIEFGKNIKRIRKEKNLTQKELAVKLDADKQKISRMECGLYDFQISSLLIIAYGLEVEINELLKIKNSDFFIKNIWKKK